MEQERQMLEREIANTSRSLQNKIEKLEETAIRTVHEVADGVKQTADRIQKSVETVSLRHQMEERPGTMMAISVGAGFVAAKALRRRARANRLVRPLVQAAPSLRRIIVTRSLGALAPVAVGLLVPVVGRWAKNRYPKSAPFVSLIEGVLATRL